MKFAPSLLMVALLAACRSNPAPQVETPATPVPAAPQASQWKAEAANCDSQPPTWLSTYPAIAQAQRMPGSSFEDFKAELSATIPPTDEGKLGGLAPYLAWTVSDDSGNADIRLFFGETNQLHEASISWPVGDLNQELPGTTCFWTMELGAVQ